MPHPTTGPMDGEAQRPASLDVPLRDAIDALFMQAKQRIQGGDAAEGLRFAEAAWAQLPPPKFGWDVSKSFTHSLARCYRQTGHFERAIELMNELFDSGTVKSYQDAPRFMLATIYFEKGDQAQAMQWFTEANRISKGRCFRTEDPRYQEFFRANKGEAR